MLAITKDASALLGSTEVFGYSFIQLSGLTEGGIVTEISDLASYDSKLKAIANASVDQITEVSLACSTELKDANVEVFDPQGSRIAPNDPVLGYSVDTINKKVNFLHSYLPEVGSYKFVYTCLNPISN